MTDGLRVGWQRQGRDLGLILRDFNEQEPRATLIALADMALAGLGNDAADGILDLLVRYHGRLRRDPAWVSIIGAAMPPLPVRPQAEAALRRLLRGLAVDDPVRYGPWWDVTLDRTALLRGTHGESLEQILVAPSPPLGWRGEPGSRLLACQPRGAAEGPEGWPDRLQARFRGIPVPLPGMRLAILEGGGDMEPALLNAGTRIALLPVP